MAIVTETVYFNGRAFIKNYSDSQKYIHGGNPEGDYIEAFDPAEAGRVYTETEIPISEDGNTLAQEVTNALEEIL